MPAHKKRPDQVRRRNTSLVTALPPDGREGDPPPWPLPIKASKDEQAYWETLWSKPQAVIWDAWMADEVVARYVRLFIRSLKANSAASLATEVRQLETQLGLTPMAVFRLQWTLGDRKPVATVTSLEEAYKDAPGEATG